MTVEEPKYLSYLLRLWPVNIEGRTVWRASLENSQTGERMGFYDLEALFSFFDQTLQTTPSGENVPIERETE